MKSLLAVLLLVIAVQGREYHYDKPQVAFQKEDVSHTAAATQPSKSIVKGVHGKDYEVTMSASRKVFETRLPPKEEVFIVQHLNQPAAPAVYQPQPAIVAPYQYPQPTGINSTPNPGFYGTLQQTYRNNPQQHLNLNSNQYNGVNAASNAQQHYNQFTANTNYQQQQQLQRQQQYGGTFSQYPQQQQQQQPQQPGVVSPRAQQLQQTGGSFSQIPLQQQQQKYYPQQYEHYLQQPQRNTNLPNSNNLLNDLVNNHKYVSQSEAAQLDVYPYKQINGNPRPFTRIITKCDAPGQCEPQNAAEGGRGGSDFHHQQVLKQSKAHVSPNTDKCQNKFNYQFTGNALTGNAAKAQRGIPITKGTDLRDRRLFAYSEVVIPQYPHN
ncbi:hypothetical protein FF38_06622 [Lucilia cuprina]|uniref:Uncharacterized protein n=1 Tax=Lucilia cuprina TaxID=7375 RepID=A0A0L0CIL7_LUCCU|nr:hypothetical protein FF38_06622 [Lucilia cuprina]